MDAETTRVMAKMAFDLAVDLAKQLITLSTAVIAFSITLTKALKDPSKGSLGLLFSAWICHLISIFFGIWALMAITGTLMPVAPPDTGATLTFGANIRVPAGLQIGTFFLASFLILCYAIKAFSSSATTAQIQKEFD